MTTVRIGVVQLTSTAEVDENLSSVRSWVEAAVREGAEWVALPENFAYMRREGETVEAAQDLDGPIVRFVCDLARDHGIWILGQDGASARGSPPRGVGRLRRSAGRTE